MKRYATLPLLLLALLGLAGPGHAAYPDRPIRILVGFPAGGPLDTHGRLLADRLQTVLGQPIKIMAAQGADPAYLDSEQFGAYLAREMPVWARAVKDSGAKLD